jgi:hypothetical protein
LHSRRQFLSQKINYLTLSYSSSDPSLSELQIGSSPVLSVLKSESVINTFRRMEKKQKSGLAIVDEYENSVFSHFVFFFFIYFFLLSSSFVSGFVSCVACAHSGREGRLVGTTTAKDLGLFLQMPTLQVKRRMWLYFSSFAFVRS